MFYILAVYSIYCTLMIRFGNTNIFTDDGIRLIRMLIMKPPLEGAKVKPVNNILETIIYS